MQTHLGCGKPSLAQQSSFATSPWIIRHFHFLFLVEIFQLFALLLFSFLIWIYLSDSEDSLSVLFTPVNWDAHIRSHPNLQRY